MGVESVRFGHHFSDYRRAAEFPDTKRHRNCASANNNLHVCLTYGYRRRWVSRMQIKRVVTERERAQLRSPWR